MNKKQWTVDSDQWSEKSVGLLARPLSGNSLTARSRRRLTTDHRALTTAFTLVELLVVIAIISAVTIATVPLMLPALDSRRIRESARMVSTEFAQAQSEAIAKGRSCGVWIQRLSADPTAAMDLFLCETPPPYSGDAVGSVALVNVFATGATVTFGNTDTSWEGQLKPGDLIRFNYGGATYQLTGMIYQSSNFVDGTVEDPAGSGNYVLIKDNTKAFQIVSINAADPSFRFPPTASAGGWLTPYQVYRQPVKSSASPISLPSGAVIDLLWSGIGSNLLYQAATGQTLTEFSDSSASSLDGKANRNLPIIVTFDRTGALEYLYIRGHNVSNRIDIQQIRLTDPIYFLIGKREKLASIETDTTQQNPADLENIWIAINSQTGLVTTAEVSSGTNSRAFAQSAQSMGGR